MADESPRAPAVTAWKDRVHAVRFYRFVQLLLGPLIRRLFATRRVGHKSLPRKGPVILVTNHVSNIDPVLVVASMPRPVYHLGKHTLFTKPFRRWFFMHLGGQIPVDRGRGGNQDAVDAAVRVLRLGLVLGIYPEGGRSPDGLLRRGRTGVARIALLTGAPVYPVAVAGTFECWPKGRKLPRLFRRTRVIVGAPRFYAADSGRVDDAATLRRITDELMSDLAVLLDQSYDPAKAELLRAVDD